MSTELLLFELPSSRPDRLTRARELVDAAQERAVDALHRCADEAGEDCGAERLAGDVHASLIVLCEIEGWIGDWDELAKDGNLSNGERVMWGTFKEARQALRDLRLLQHRLREAEEREVAELRGVNGGAR